MYLIDFGFSNTVVRNISYAWGAIKLAREGFDDFKPSNKINFKLINEIYNATFQIYFIISIIAISILFIFGTIYINSLIIEFDNDNLNSGLVYFCPWCCIKFILQLLDFNSKRNRSNRTKSKST